MIDQVQNLAEDVQGTLRLGVSNNFAISKFPQIIASFNKVFPKVKIQLQTGLGIEIMKLLEEGEIHIGIKSAGYKWAEQKVLIDSSKICLISKEEMTLQDLPSENMIYIATPSIKKVFTNWWPAMFKTAPMITMETDYVETGKRMVINGLGVAFVPAFCLEPSDPVHIIELVQMAKEEYIMESWMNYRESTVELSVVREFIQFMKDRI